MSENSSPDSDLNDLLPPTKFGQGTLFVTPEVFYEKTFDLDAGGMGTVCVATEQGPLRRQVVIKRMRRDWDTEYSHERFLREAALAANLGHPNIIAIHAVGKHAGLPFYAMEYPQGARSLSKILRQAQIAIPRAHTLLRQALLGIGAIHSLPGSPCHRDIKPANLLVAEMPGGGELLKIIDFGVARWGEEADADPEERPGTVGYKAPELYIRKPPTYMPSLGDMRSDLYAVGVTFFEVFCGKHPFPDAATSEVDAYTLFQSGKASPPQASRIRKEAAAYDAIFCKMLAIEPDERYQTAAEIIADLDKITASDSSHAASRTTWPWRQMTLAFVAGIVLTGILSASLFARLNNSSKSEVAAAPVLMVPTESVPEPLQNKPSQPAAETTPLKRPKAPVKKAPTIEDMDLNWFRSKQLDAKPTKK